MANRSLVSLASINVVEYNQTQFDVLVATLEPNLFMIWQYLQIYSMNPEILLHIMKAVYDVSSLYGMGKVIIEIKKDREGLPSIGRINMVEKTEDLKLSIHR